MEIFDFDWFDFLAPLDPSVLLMSLVLGAGVGLASTGAGAIMGLPHFFWQIAGGAVFFIPLSLIRAFQGSEVWERFLASYLLWAVFVGGMAVSPYIRRHFR